MISRPTIYNLKPLHLASPSALRHHPRQEPRALTRLRGSVRGTGVSQFPTAMRYEGQLGNWRRPIVALGIYYAP